MTADEHVIVYASSVSCNCTYVPAAVLPDPHCVEHQLVQI